MNIFVEFGGYISSLIVVIFQIVKWIINNKKMKKEFKDISGVKTLEKIDYDKFADAVMNKLDSKIKNDVEKEVKNEKD